MKVIMKYAGNMPISLDRSWYQGWENQKENPSQMAAVNSETRYFSFTEKYTVLPLPNLLTVNGRFDASRLISANGAAQIPLPFT